MPSSAVDGFSPWDVRSPPGFQTREYSLSSALGAGGVLRNVKNSLLEGIGIREPNGGAVRVTSVAGMRLFSTLLPPPHGCVPVCCAVGCIDSS